MARSQKLVFRWVGKNIEGASTSYRKYITNIQREEYLRYLDEALTVGKGLFATPYTDEYLGRRISKKTRKTRGIWELGSDLPCLSFTEVDLGDCADHRLKYGRLALGFVSGVPAPPRPPGTTPQVIKRPGAGQTNILITTAKRVRKGVGCSWDCLME